MPAPRNNQFWKRRAKHGPPVLFTDAEKLWTAACEYFEFCDANPLKAEEIYGAAAKRCVVNKMRVYTLEGLYLYLGVNHSYFSQYKIRLDKLKKPTAKEKELRDMIHRIEQTIYVQKFEGAAAGLLNPVIISKSLGLTEKQEIDQKTDGKLKQTITVRYANRDNTAEAAPGATEGTE